MVRMAAVAIIDVASGRIEALAGAMSPCARQEVDGPGRDANCDKRLPYPVQYRPDALLNPAVFHDAMPASTIKPIMAAAFLSDPDGHDLELCAPLG
jgi:cell division protein FtsI/penicillin-binding protein 2